MNKLTLREAVGRVLLGMSAAAAGSMFQPAALAQEQPQAGAQPAGTPSTMEEVVVTGRQRSVADDILSERMESEVVSDLISAEQISRVGDSTVSTALRRLPGVTLVGDQFIYIRGLGERYSSTTVNGAYVPSPDLTRNVIPMDLFPSEIVESLSIQKGYTADQPAAFGGGNVDIRTRSIPDDFEFNLQFGIGTNSESSDDGIEYPAARDDELGTDDGTRAMPQEIQDAIQTYRGNLSTEQHPEHAADGRRVPLARRGPADQPRARDQPLPRRRFRRQVRGSGRVDRESAGNSWYLGRSEQWKIGVMGLGDYKNNWRNRERTIRP